MGELTKNTNVIILSKRGNWYKIQYEDDTAYVSKKYVSDDPEVVEAANRLAAGEEIVEYAKEFLGVPYVYGGTTPSGFDCSGFVRYVYAKFGISLPRISYDQLKEGTSVSEEDLQVGDLVFFRGGDHVGIYVGNGQYIHAPRTGRTVSVEPLNRGVYAARRIL
ncbi:MAG: C40 family peptidase [Clostridia bacterium]|nr:C40 family peptidase [Clostridia bacterium]